MSDDYERRNHRSLANHVCQKYATSLSSTPPPQRPLPDLLSLSDDIFRTVLSYADSNDYASMRATCWALRHTLGTLCLPALNPPLLGRILACYVGVEDHPALRASCKTLRAVLWSAAYRRLRGSMVETTVSLPDPAELCRRLHRGVPQGLTHQELVEQNWLIEEDYTSTGILEECGVERVCATVKFDGVPGGEMSAFVVPRGTDEAAAEYDNFHVACYWNSRELEHAGYDFCNHRGEVRTNLLASSSSTTPNHSRTMPSDVGGFLYLAHVDFTGLPPEYNPLVAAQGLRILLNETLQGKWTLATANIDSYRDDARRDPSILRLDLKNLDGDTQKTLRWYEMAGFQQIRINGRLYVYATPSDLCTSMPTGNELDISLERQCQDGTLHPETYARFENLFLDPETEEEEEEESIEDEDDDEEDEDEPVDPADFDNDAEFIDERDRFEPGGGLYYEQEFGNIIIDNGHNGDDDDEYEDIDY